VAYAFSHKIKIIDLDGFEGHWQPVRSAILATARLLVLESFAVLRAEH